VNERLAIQLVLLALEHAPQLQAMLQRGVTQVELEALLAADDAERARLQAAIDAP
jgi:hypothetical protein